MGGGWRLVLGRKPGMPSGTHADLGTVVTEFCWICLCPLSSPATAFIKFPRLPDLEKTKSHRDGSMAPLQMFLGSAPNHSPHPPDFTKLASPIKMNLPTSMEKVNGFCSAKGHASCAFPP